MGTDPSLPPHSNWLPGSHHCHFLITHNPLRTSLARGLLDHRTQIHKHTQRCTQICKDMKHTYLYIHSHADLNMHTLNYAHTHKHSTRTLFQKWWFDSCPLLQPFNLMECELISSRQHTLMARHKGHTHTHIHTAVSEPKNFRHTNTHIYAHKHAHENPKAQNKNAHAHTGTHHSLQFVPMTQSFFFIDSPYDHMRQFIVLSDTGTSSIVQQWT